MSFYNRTNNGQTHAETFFLSGEELLEQTGAVSFPDASAVIAHAYTSFAAAIGRSSYFHLAFLRRCLAHGIKGIANEVNQDLLDLHRITFHRGNIIIQGGC